VSVLVHDDDEPAGPVPARYCRALLEIACEHHRVGASGGIARQVNAFVIIENLFAVGETEIITWPDLGLWLQQYRKLPLASPTAAFTPEMSKDMADGDLGDQIACIEGDILAETSEELRDFSRS
jgi:hypothetical protein